MPTVFIIHKQSHQNTHFIEKRQINSQYGSLRLSLLMVCIVNQYKDRNKKLSSLQIQRILI